MRRALVALASAAALVLSLAACGASEPTPEAPEETDAAEAPAGDVELDERDFCLLGNGAGDLLAASNWGQNTTDDHKLERAEGTNEYSITLDLYVGDEFQFAINGDWADQKGAGYVVDPVKDGEEYFADSEGAGLTSDTKKMNIQVAKEGNYTLTLTTNPANEDEDTITWVYNGDAAEAIDYAALDMYVRGNLITNWTFDQDSQFKMRSYLNGTFTYEAELFKGDVLVFYNVLEDGSFGSIVVKADAIDTENSSEHLTTNPKGDIVVAADGTYSFTYDATTNTLVAEYDPEMTVAYEPGSDWFIMGSGSSDLMLTSGWGKAGGVGEGDDIYRLTPDGENRYSITADLAKGDQFVVGNNVVWGYKHDCKFIVEPERDGVEHFTERENVRVAVPGNYTLTLVLDPEGYAGDRLEWVRNGDMTNPNTGPFDVFVRAAGSGWELSEPAVTEDGVATFTYEFGADEAFTIVYYASDNTEERGGHRNPGSSILGVETGETGSANSSFEAQGNDFLAKDAGTYTVTVDFTQGGPVVDFEKN